MKKLIIAIFMVITLQAGTVFSQEHITNYHYDPGYALHPFKIVSLLIRPPVALLNVFIKGGYYALDSEPARRAFNIEYPARTIDIDEDY